MLVILRMNRKSMLVMREHYNQLTKRITSDGRTIVDADAGRSKIVHADHEVFISSFMFIHVCVRVTVCCS